MSLETEREAGLREGGDATRSAVESDGRAVEEALRESEERFRRTFDQAPVGQAIVSLDGRFLRANAELCRITGYCEDELCRMTFRDITHPDDLELSRSETRRLYAGEVESFRLDKRYVRKDGTTVWARTGVSLMKDAHGKPLYTLPIVEDITERKLASEAVQRSEEKLRALIETTQTGYVILTASGTVLDANAEYARLAGRASVAEILGRNVVEWTAPYDRERNASEVALCLGRGHVRGLEIDYVDSQGRTTPVEINATVVGEGEAQQILTLCRDIGGRRRADQDLRQREQRFRAIVETTQEWIWAIDATGLHTYSNRAVEAILGYSPEELLGKRASALLHPEDRSRIESLLREKVAAREGWTGLLVRWLHKDGSVRYLESNAVPVVDAEGCPIGYQGADRDITERLRAEEEKDRLEIELIQAQKMEAIGRLAGGVAHDFNNLLTAIRGYADLALAGVDHGSRAARHLRGIGDVVDQAKGMTQQILAFSRRQVLQMKSVDLNAELLSAGKMLRRLIGEQIEIETRMEPDLGRVRADSSQLQQVLINLAINARDAMPQGGTLTITTATVSLPAGTLATAPDAPPGRYVQLTVADTGVGMDPAMLSRIFEPFFTTKELGRGTGLGLATVYGIVRQHGGSIDVESTIGSGSVFRVYLPLAEDVPASETSTTVPSAGLRGSETILVVEDDALVRSLTCEQLSDFGYQVLSASGPVEALVLVQRRVGPIDLVLSDVVMPDMNGREMHERLRALRPGVRVLFMSGYAGEALARQDGVLEPGLNLIQKPFSIADLTLAIRELMKDRGASGQR